MLRRALVSFRNGRALRGAAVFASLAAIELSFVSSACAAPTPAVPLPVVSTRLAAALDTVNSDKIRADLYFVADDLLEGRDTPSTGLKITARFLRARLERLGWKPGTPNGYFHEYPLESNRLDETASKITWRKGDVAVDLAFGSDYWLPSTFEIVDLSTSGGVVYCGRGRKDDFESANVTGKWALCTDPSQELRPLRNLAREKGALGVILAPSPDAPLSEREERLDKDLARLRRGSVSQPSKKKEEARPVFPQLVLQRPAARALLAAISAGGALPAIGADTGVTFSETRDLEGEGGLIQVENVCGLWPGSDPVLSKEVIIVSAHYDHVGMAGGVVHNGADDNGSGTCGLLALAEALTHYGPMRRSVMLIWVSGEEKGLWGSAAWAASPSLPEGFRAVADVNLDMIGRNAPDKLLVTPTKEHDAYNGLVQLTERIGELEGFPTLGSADQYYKRSDHINFAKLGIPVMFLFSDVHEDYHQPGDDPEKVDYDKVRRVTRLVLRILDGLQTDEMPR